MNAVVQILFRRVARWPKEAVAELIQAINDIETKYLGLYKLSDDERAAVREGLAQAERGEFVPDEEIAAVFNRFRK